MLQKEDPYNGLAADSCRHAFPDPTTRDDITNVFKEPTQEVSTKERLKLWSNYKKSESHTIDPGI